MKTQDEYRKDGTHCPNCNSENINAEDYSHYCKGLTVSLSCDDCHLLWVEDFKLRGYEVEGFSVSAE